MPKTKSTYRQETSSPLAPTLRLVVVRGIEIDGGEGFQDPELLSASNIFLERPCHRFFLGAMSSALAGFLDQPVI
jgi:hypothetical protein